MEATKEKIRIYVDTNVWLGYYNATVFKGNKFKTAKHLIDFIELLKKIEPAVIFSYFNYVELTEVIRDTLINMRLLGEGYSVFDLSKVRKRDSKTSELSDDEKEELGAILGRLTSFKFIHELNIDEAESIDENMARQLYILTGSFYIGMPDAFHLIHALKSDSELFITNDKPLITSFRKVQAEMKEFKKIRILKPEEVLGSPKIIQSQ